MTERPFTPAQVAVLVAATTDRPVYGEASPRITQAPGGAAIFDLRSIAALERRGLLRSDDRGGYLLTAQGVDARRRALGLIG